MEKVRIGILKEENDKRAIFLPQHLVKLTHRYEFSIESGLGEQIGYSDDDYFKVGIEIKKKENIWKESDLIFKYKKPLIKDVKEYGENKTLLSLLHPEGDVDLVKELISKNVRGFSFEYFKKNNIYPLAYVGGQIAGKMGVFYANHYLQTHFDGLGKSLFHVNGAEKAHVLVIGHGNVGRAAISTALHMGCKVTVMGKDFYKFRKEAIYLQEDIEFIVEEQLDTVLPDVDAVIGAILISVNSTPAIIDEKRMKKLKKRSVIIDVTCGYGLGYLPELFEKTTLESPIKITKTGQLYCKIDNLPSAYPLTASEAYGEQISIIIPEIVDHIIHKKRSDFIASGEITSNKKVVHEGVYNDLLIINEGDILDANKL